LGTDILGLNSTASFWDYLGKLVDTSPLKIDRPRGTSHPHYPELVYPLDYGYLEGTTAADGAGIDFWLGASGSHALSDVILTVDLLRRDTEIKLILGCTVEEIKMIQDFHNTKSMRAFLVHQPGLSSSSHP
jgi:inorganic pyrophosphatase